MPRLGVVTSIVGNYDSLKEPSPQDGVTFVCYTTVRSTRPSAWTRVPIESVDGRRQRMMRAKYYKMHLLDLPEVADCEYVMWVDGSFEVQKLPDPEDILPDGKRIGVFKHSQRSNLVDEVQYCSNNTNEYLRARYHDQNMHWQLVKYIEDQFDVTQDGLYEMGNFIVRRDPQVSALLKDWYRQNELYTFQDQLSFPYVVWKHGLRDKLHLLGDNIFTGNKYAVYSAHTSRRYTSSSGPMTTTSGRRSFDCFDTLIVRAHKDPHRIFDYMGRVLAIPDFKRNRILCESSSLLETYRTMQAKGFLRGRSVQLMAHYEYYLEVARSAVNRDALREFQAGDYVLSDTTWSSDQIRDLLSHWNVPCGEVIAAPNGKRHGTSYQGLNVEWHLGDNKVTDVEAAFKHGTIGRLYTGSEYTWRESYLATLGLDTLAGLCRVLRVSNPFDSEADDRRHLWDLYSQVWLPLAVFIVQAIREQADGRPVVYLARDMFVAYHLHKAIYPDEDIRYVQFSRRAASLASNEFLSYVRASVPNDSVVVDLQGRGKTFTDFRIRYNIPVHLFVTVFSGGDVAYDRHVRLSNYYNDYIERMYYSNHGSVYDLNRFFPKEYDNRLVDVYMSQLAQSTRRRIPLVRDELQDELNTSKVSFDSAARRLLVLDVPDVELMASIDHQDDHFDEVVPPVSALSLDLVDPFEEFIGEYPTYQYLIRSIYVPVPRGTNLSEMTYSPIPQRIDPDVVQLEQTKRVSMRPFGKTLADELVSILPARGGKLLDFACGLSYACEDAHRSRDFHAVRIDASDAVCHYLTKTNPYRDTVICAPSMRCIASSNFDVVFLGEFLMCEPHYQVIVRQAVNRLRPGGHLLVTTYYDANNASHSIRFHHDRFLSLCADGRLSLRRYQCNESMHDYMIAVYRLK